MVSRPAARILRIGMAATGLGLASAAHAADTSPMGIDFKGLVDLRGIVSSPVRSWEDGGLGKTRYGGDAGGRRVLARAEAALVIEPRISWDITGLVQLNVAPEQHRSPDVIEAYLQYKPVPTGSWGVKLKAGMFFPPISLENTGLAWTSPYTISSSAINSWVGEELRTFGGEATLIYRTDLAEVSVLGALHKLNDPAGTLLAWRGWAIHDRETGPFDRVPLPQVRVIRPAGGLAKQSPDERPYVEIDKRVGYYAGFRVDLRDVATVTLLRYDNRADDLMFANGQWPWRTDFWSLGLKVPLPGDVDIVGQAMTGKTTVITTPRGPLVAADFQSAYGLVSKAWGRHRLSLRADWFKTKDVDTLTLPDNNNEHGYGLTASYIFRPTLKQRLTLEVLFIDSTRSERQFFGLSTRAKESQFQISYRFFL